MKLLLIVVAFWLTAGGANLLKNGNFEKFAGGEPVGWTTNNIPSMLVVVSSTPLSASGKRAVRCEVKKFYETNMAGMLRQTQIRVEGREIQLKGWYQFNPVGNDVGFVSIDVKSASGSTVGVCDHMLREPTQALTPFTFSSRLPAEAHTVDLLLTIIPSSEEGSLHEGSSIVFDDLELTITTASTQP